jgi:hypothetical protein
MDDRGSILGGARLFSAPLCPEGNWSQHNILTNGCLRLFPRGKAARA